MISRIDRLLTIADPEALPEDGNRYELIEGELFASCAGGLAHQIGSDNIVSVLKSYLKKFRIGTVVSTPGLILDKYSGVIPDIVFFRNENYERVVTGERLTRAPVRGFSCMIRQIFVLPAILPAPHPLMTVETFT